MSVDHTNLHVVIEVTESQRYGVVLARSEVTCSAPSLADDAQGIEQMVEGLIARMTARVLEDLGTEAKQRADMERSHAA